MRVGAAAGARGVGAGVGEGGRLPGRRGAPHRGAGAAAVRMRVVAVVLVGRGVGGEGGGGLRGAAGEDVEGGVDADFKVAPLGGVRGIGFGETEDDLGGVVSKEVPGEVECIEWREGSMKEIF